jgi:membrane associated rhomboid family serine protease
LYFVGGVATSFVSIYYNYFTNEVVNLVGASGAISVLLGWYALKDRYQREGIIVWILLISFAPLLLGMPIAWYSHIAGFVIGFVSGYIL